MLKLYGYNRSRSTRALWALEECEADYEYAHVDFGSGEARQPPFLEINPAGKVPVLVHDDLVLTESAAICTYIGSLFPERHFVPDPHSPARAIYDQWCFFVIGELEQPLWTMGKHRFAIPRKWRVPEILETAAWEFKVALKTLTTKLGDRQYLLGDRFSFADLLVAHTLSWARNFDIPLPDSDLEDYADRILDRPAAQRALAKEKP